MNAKLKNTLARKGQAYANRLRAVRSAGLDIKENGFDDLDTNSWQTGYTYSERWPDKPKAPKVIKAKAPPVKLTGLQSLTPREREVLDLMVAGDANKIIAYKLSLSQRTVEIHRSKVMSRMQVDSFAELIRIIISMEFEEKIKRLESEVSQLRQSCGLISIAA